MKRDLRGFAVPVVVFMLAAVMLLMGTAYEIIRVVGDVRSAARDGILAEKAGEAAVARFRGDRIGTPPDSESIQYTASTRVKVRARRLGRISPFRTNYILTGEAEHGTTFPAKRTVRELAVLEPPAEPLAVLSIVSGGLTVANGATVNGSDAATSGACVAATGNIGGAYAAGAINTTGNPISGNPNTRTVGSKATAISQLAVRWESLLGPEAPVQYTSPSAWPSFATLHVDTFPLIRITGDFSPTSAHSGRGALIVTGTIRPGSSFNWSGVIFAGALGTTTTPAWTLRGLIIAGFDPLAGAVTVPSGPNLQYNRCHVMRAFAKLSHLEPVTGTGWTER